MFFKGSSSRDFMATYLYNMAMGQKNANPNGEPQVSFGLFFLLPMLGSS